MDRLDRPIQYSIHFALVIAHLKEPVMLVCLHLLGILNTFCYHMDVKYKCIPIIAAIFRGAMTEKENVHMYLTEMVLHRVSRLHNDIQI